MEIRDSHQGKQLTLSKPLDSGTKALYFFYSVAFFIGALGFIYMAVGDPRSDHAVASYVLLALALVLLFASYRFGNKAFYTEKLIILPDRLQLLRAGFRKQTAVYTIDKISQLRYLEKPELTKHPLAGDNFDYLGFATEQKVISEMHGDKRVAFNYEGRTISFAENFYSWDFEEMEAVLLEVTGKDLTAPEHII